MPTGQANTRLVENAAELINSEGAVPSRTESNASGTKTGVTINLVRIENIGQGIGPDLKFEININSYPGQGVSFEKAVPSGGHSLDTPVFSQEFHDSFDARIGVAISITEDDPVYIDSGAGGGFIDTYLRGVQEIKVPVVAREGKNLHKTAIFVFYFAINIIEYVTVDGGTVIVDDGVEDGGGHGSTGEHPKDPPPPVAPHC